MAESSNEVNIYLETGQKRSFAGAIEWPGWCRSGVDESSAVQALFDYAPRYANVLNETGLTFQAPAQVSMFLIIDRLQGNATTDFGAPAMAPAGDSEGVDEEDLQCLQTILNACWRALDAAVEQADGKELRKGPRGGGRDVGGIVKHVLGAEAAYLGQVGWKFKQDKEAELSKEISRTRQAVLDALAASAHGEIVERGPHGGLRWTARYFTRRVAWHVLDHAWEIEDRLLEDGVS